MTAGYWVTNRVIAIAKEMPTAEAVAAVESTPILLSAIANRMMMGVAVNRPICASLMVWLVHGTPMSDVYRR